MLEELKNKNFVDLTIYSIKDTCEPIAEHTNIELECINFTKIDGKFICIVSCNNFIINRNEKNGETIEHRFVEHNSYPMDFTTMTMGIVEHKLSKDDIHYGLAAPSLIGKLLEINTHYCTDKTKQYNKALDCWECVICKKLYKLEGDK